MSNPEHLVRLIAAQGSNIVAWNQWRERHEKLFLDLKGADLRHTNLQKANLRGCLWEARMPGENA